VRDALQHRRRQRWCALQGELLRATPTESFPVGLNWPTLYSKKWARGSLRARKADGNAHRASLNPAISLGTTSNMGMAILRLPADRLGTCVASW
jgi:hypothetical protein